jgi:hypothetical protein
MHIGWDNKLQSYWLDRLGNNYKHIKSNKILSIYTSRLLNRSKSKVDLVLVESGKNAKSNAYKNGFMLPRWMEMIVDIESSLKKSRIKNIVRNIKKHKLAYETRNSNEDFDVFYHQMYRPFSIKRHGEAAEIADYRHFANKFRKGHSTLFFITKNDEAIASAYVEINNNMPRISAFGVKNASDEIFKLGVIGALYYFIMLHYLNKGIENAFVGNSMPLLFDGVTEFKMQIGAMPYLKDLANKQKTFLIPFSSNAHLIKTLQYNPLFHLTNDRLNISSFNATNHFFNKEDFLKYLKRIKWNNAEKFTFYYHNNKTVFDEWLDNTEIPNIEFRNFKSLIE